MADIVEFPIPTAVLDPADWPEFRGAAGPATEWRASATHLQARPVGGDTWTDVVALSEITGPEGDITSSGDATDGQVLTATGAGGVAWEDPTPSGTKTLRQFTPLDNQPPATGFATLDTRNSIALLDFDDATVESALFVGFIPEGADLTSGILVRIAWMATTATSGNVRWRAAFEKSNTDLDSDSFDTATEANGAADAASGKPIITEITCTTIDSLAAGDLFRVRISRVGNDATNDTMAGDAELIAVELRGVA